MKFPLGTKVVTKKTGLPATGVIEGITTSRFYAMQHQIKVLSEYKWTKIFPDWYQKPVYLVKLNTPQKSLSYEEFVEGFIESNKEDETLDIISEEDLKLRYEAIPAAYIISYCEDDLEEA